MFYDDITKKLNNYTINEIYLKLHNVWIRITSRSSSVNILFFISCVTERNMKKTKI